MGTTYDSPLMIPVGVLRMPGYVIGAESTWNETFSLMWRDFWNALGSAYGDSGLRVVNVA